MAGRGCPSPGPIKADGRIPFISVGDAEGDAWPKPVSMTKEAQEFIAQIEGPICVLVCMGAQGTDKVSMLIFSVYRGSIRFCASMRVLTNIQILSVLGSDRVTP